MQDIDKTIFPYGWTKNDGPYFLSVERGKLSQFWVVQGSSHWQLEHEV